MRIRNYLVVFCMLIFSISMMFVGSCVENEKKSESREEDSKLESGKTASPAGDAASENLNTDIDISKGTAYINLLNDQPMYFSDYKDHVLIVDFWATWCPPCRMEIPWFIEFHNKYKDKNFEVIGVSVDKTGADKVKQFMGKVGINYPVIMATDEILKEYENKLGGPIRSIPTTFIRNKAGQIVNTHIGVPRSDDPKKVFEEEIIKLLNEG